MKTQDEYAKENNDRLRDINNKKYATESLFIGPRSYYLDYLLGDVSSEDLMKIRTAENERTESRGSERKRRNARLAQKEKRRRDV